MKSGWKNLLSHPHALQNETHGDSPSRSDSRGRELDRRRFLQYMAGAGAVAGWGRRAIAQGDTTASANLRLPDGTAIPLWEQPLTFSKTYYVDNQSSKADDSGPGTSARPFRTIGKAAKVLQPGERVVIASGIYRECVRPERGGTGPTQMISYEAAPGAKVFIKGSEVVKDGWTLDPAISFRRPAAVATGNPVTPPPAATPTWGYQFIGAMFPDAYNPFALASVAGDRAWLDTKAVDMGPYFRRRGLVFVDGKPLEPVELQRELVSPKLYAPPLPERRSPLPVCPRARAAAQSCRRSAARRMAGSGPMPTASRSTSACRTALRRITRSRSRCANRCSRH